MEKKKTHGGARKKAGRKPVEDKKQQVNLFLEGSLIELHGGKTEVQQKCYAFLREGKNKYVQLCVGLWVVLHSFIL